MGISRGVIGLLTDLARLHIDYINKKGGIMKHDKDTVTYTELKNMGACDAALEWFPSIAVDKLCIRCQKKIEHNISEVYVKDLYQAVLKEHPEWSNWMHEHFTDRALGIKPTEKHDKDTITYNELRAMGACKEGLDWLWPRVHWHDDYKLCVKHASPMGNCELLTHKLYQLVLREHPEWSNWMREHFTDRALGIPQTNNQKPTTGFNEGDCVRMGSCFELSIIAEREPANEYGIIHYVLDYPKNGKFQYQLSPESNLTLVYPARVVEAIKGSWRKWNYIYLGKQKNNGMDDCPLCKIFAFSGTTSRECVNCPISLKTGEVRCLETPYKKGPTVLQSLAFRDWIGELLPQSVVIELLKESSNSQPETSNLKPVTSLKYHVGDKVVIRKDLMATDDSSIYGISVNEKMKAYIGKVATIIGFQDSNSYKIDLDVGWWWWWDTMFSGLASKWCCAPMTRCQMENIIQLETTGTYCWDNERGGKVHVDFCPFCNAKPIPPAQPVEETFKIGDIIKWDVEEFKIIRDDSFSGEVRYRVRLLTIDGLYRLDNGYKAVFVENSDAITLSELRNMVGDNNAKFEKII